MENRGCDHSVNVIYFADEFIINLLDLEDGWSAQRKVLASLGWRPAFFGTAM